MFQFCQVEKIIKELMVIGNSCEEIQESAEEARTSLVYAFEQKRANLVGELKSMISFNYRSQGYDDSLSRREICFAPLALSWDHRRKKKMFVQQRCR